VRDLERLVRQRGAPEFIRPDNGPKCVARAVRDWIAAKGFKTYFIEPGSPWQNAYIESFNSRFRDEFLNLEVFGSLLEANMLGEEHRYKYNHQRPHSSLGDLTQRSSHPAVLLRYGQWPPLRRTAQTNPTPDSHSNWFKERGHSNIAKAFEGTSSIPVSVLIRVSFFLAQRPISVILRSLLWCHLIWRNARKRIRKRSHFRTATSSTIRRAFSDASSQFASTSSPCPTTRRLVKSRGRTI
jgi:hypothetical protein